MTTFTFNQEKVTEKIKEVSSKILNDIKNNMSKGVRDTEMYIPKDIKSEVVEIIEKEIAAQNFNWVIVQRGSNPYTGKPQSFTGVSMSDGTMYKKLRYYGN